jgi:flagellin
LSASSYLNKNSREQGESLAKLSSGSRIASASDDISGLAISTQLNADISTLRAASQNAMQAMSVLRTADDSLARVSDLLQRQSALTVQAKSGSVDAASRGFINQEFQAIKLEIRAIGANTAFNGTRLINGTYNATNGRANFQVGLSATDTILANLTTVNVTNTGLLSLPPAISVTTYANANTAMTRVTTDVDRISAFRATVGSFMSRFEYRSDVITSSIENLQSAKSSILDVDLAAEQTNLINQQVLTESSMAALSQSNKRLLSLLALVR